MDPNIAVGGGILWQILSVLFLALLLCLILAPLFIWKWTKATKAEVTRLNDNIIVLVSMLKRWERRYLLVDGEEPPKIEDERIKR